MIDSKEVILAVKVPEDFDEAGFIVGREIRGQWDTTVTPYNYRILPKSDYCDDKGDFKYYRELAAEWKARCEAFAVEPQPPSSEQECDLPDNHKSLSAFCDAYDHLKTEVTVLTRKLTAANEQLATTKSAHTVSMDQLEARLAESYERLAAKEAGLPIKQEPKYTINGTHIINRATGEAIPHDEPVFILRAKDENARGLLSIYCFEMCEGSHREAVRGRWDDFIRFANTYPDRMKKPDTAANQPKG